MVVSFKLYVTYSYNIKWNNDITVIQYKRNDSILTTSKRGNINLTRNGKGRKKSPSRKEFGYFVT